MKLWFSLMPERIRAYIVITSFGVGFATGVLYTVLQGGLS